jgi:hypothetical protein
MSDKVEGVLEIGCNEFDEIVINHPQLKTDENGVGHIVFSIGQAYTLAQILNEKIRQAEQSIYMKKEELRIKSIPPVDRTAQTLIDGSPVTEDHREIDPETGQQKGYVVLSEEERKKGFVRPVRRSYIHKVCGIVISMGISIAETYTKDPGFYSGIMCVHCKAHFPLDQFVWEGTTEQVGS